MTEFFLGTVNSVNNDGVEITLDGQSTPMTKHYKQMVTGYSLSANDRVVVMKESGTYLVLGKIALTGGSSSGLLVERVTHGTELISGSSAKNVTVDAAKTGYSVVGLVGYNTYNSASGSNWNNVVPVRMIQSAQTIAFVFRNVSATDATISLSVDVLYKPS